MPTLIQYCCNIHIFSSSGLIVPIASKVFINKYLGFLFPLDSLRHHGTTEGASQEDLPGGALDAVALATTGLCRHGQTLLEKVNATYFLH